jgi:hypothetical protein
MTSIFTPRKFQNYCYVVKSEDDNSYDIGVFMEFKSLKQYFKKTMEWKFSKLITEEQFIKMCCDNYIIVDKMEIIDYNDDEEYDRINTFLSVVAQYQEFKIKLLFTKPKIDDKISICYRNYLLNSDLRKKITTRENIIKTDTNIYTDGMCGRI